MANIVATLININRRKGKAAVTPADVLGKSKPDKPIRAKTDALIVPLMERMVAKYGGTIKHLDTND